jgi:hypothetical protein
MRGFGRAAVLGALLLLGMAAAEAADLRFSGQVAAVDPGGGTILVEELGPSPGPQPAVIARSVTVTAQTAFEVIERGRQDGGWPGEFKQSPGTSRDLRAGDFVTVIARVERGALQAVTVSVIRPDTAR